MSKLITVQNEVAEVSDELYEFMESDRKHQAAETEQTLFDCTKAFR